MKHGIRAAALSMALALIFAMTACDGEAASAKQGRNIFSTMESGFGPVETGNPSTGDESALKQVRQSRRSHRSHRKRSSLRLPMWRMRGTTGDSFGCHDSCWNPRMRSRSTGKSSIRFS